MDLGSEPISKTYSVLQRVGLMPNLCIGRDHSSGDPGKEKAIYHEGVKVIPQAGTVWSSIEMGDGKALFWLELRLSKRQGVCKFARPI